MCPVPREAVWPAGPGRNSRDSTALSLCLYTLHGRYGVWGLELLNCRLPPSLPCDTVRQGNTGTSHAVSPRIFSPSYFFLKEKPTKSSPTFRIDESQRKHLQQRHPERRAPIVPKTWPPSLSPVFLQARLGSKGVRIWTLLQTEEECSRRPALALQPASSP